MQHTQSFKVLAFKNVGKDRDHVVLVRKLWLVLQTECKTVPALPKVSQGFEPPQLPCQEGQFICTQLALATKTGGCEGRPALTQVPGAWVCWLSEAGHHSSNELSLLQNTHIFRLFVFSVIYHGA